MRIVFIGTVEFSLKALEKLITLDANIVGVCAKENSSFNADFADLTPLCHNNKIPYMYVENINSTQSLNWIQKLQPDIIFCFGWSSLLKKELLAIAPMGVIGYHPAMLPYNRGRHPIIWALALGLEYTGSTFFFMDKGADSGDILSQEKIKIQYEDDAQSLYSKIITTAINQIEKFIPKLTNNTYKKISQDNTKSNCWRKRSSKDGLIDFRMSSNAIYNLVRALTKPYIGAHTRYNNQDITIWKVEEVKETTKNIEPGKVLKVQNNIITIKTYDNAINILEHQFDILPQEGEYL